MHYAAANGHEDVITVLLSFKAEIDYSRKKGVFIYIYSYMTPLHIAVKYGYPDVAEFLLEKGAKVNKANIVFFLLIL